MTGAATGIGREPAARALDCAPNFRDVAALVPGLRRGVLFRSDLVCEPDAASHDLIAGFGIRLVLDLRSPDEQAARPNKWFQEEGVELAAFNVSSGGDPRRLMAALGAGGGASSGHSLMVEIYRLFPEGALPALRFLGERIAAGDLPVLVHCAAGKDRTGFTIAALLLAVGIAPEAVERDYLASGGRVHARTIAHTREMMREHFQGALDDAALDCINGVHGDYLRSALAAIAETHGSLQAYQHAAGLSGERLEHVRRRLLG